MHSIPQDVDPPLDAGDFSWNSCFFILTSDEKQQGKVRIQEPTATSFPVASVAFSARCLSTSPGSP